MMLLGLNLHRSMDTYPDFILFITLLSSNPVNENTNEGDNICSVLYLLCWEIASGEYCPVPDNESYIAFSIL